LSAVTGFPSIYWTITGDTVSLMDSASRAAVDAAALSAQRDATAAALDQIEDIRRAFALAVVDQFNQHATTGNAILAAVTNGATFADIKTNMAAIPAPTTPTIDELKVTVRNELGT
jgi:hypothetical protein